MTECTQTQFAFQAHGSRQVTAQFDGGTMTFGRRRAAAAGSGPEDESVAAVPAGPRRHKLPEGYRVTSMPVLGGLHHEYGLEKEAA